MIEENGSVCQKHPTSYSTTFSFLHAGFPPQNACALGTLHYSKGRHRLRMRAEGDVFMGIISNDITPQESDWAGSRTVHGWFVSDYYVLNGDYQRKRWNGEHKSCDAYELKLDCKNSMLEIKNERTLESDKMKVERANLPWRPFFIVGISGGVHCARVHLL